MSRILAVLWIAVYIYAANSQVTTLNIGSYESDVALLQSAASDLSTSDIVIKVSALPAQQEQGIDFDIITELSEHLDGSDLHTIVGAFEHNVAIATEKAGIPYLVGSFATDSTKRQNELYMLPAIDDICDCVLDIVEAYGWKEMAIFYEDFILDDAQRGKPDSLHSHVSDAMMLGKLLNDPQKGLRVWKIQPAASEQELKTSLIDMRQLGITKVLALTQSKTSENLLQQARSLGIAAYPYSWLLLNLSGGRFLAPILEDLASNVTTVNFAELSETVGNDDVSLLKDSLLRDTLKILVTSMKDITDAGMTMNLNNLQESIKLTSVVGHTGIINFDEDGRRSNFTMSIYNYFGNEPKLIAHWKRNNNKQLYFTGVDEQREDSRVTLTGQNVKVVSILESPWLMLRNDQEGLVGNARFEGFISDIMDAVSEKMGFTYELYLVPDGNFGLEMENGEWNGMIQELLNGNATMAASALSIDSIREAAIDFTKPFFTRYLNAIVKTQKEETNFFQFMLPFSSTVWCCILGSTGIVCIALFFLERYSTSLRSEGDDTPDMSASESLWFTLAAILQQGGETTPATPAGRIVAAFWWFFGLIIITSYTANLTAFLTVKNINPPITSVADLVTQTKVKYGTVKNSAVENFFKLTSVEPYRMMWEQMVLLDSNVNNSHQGVVMAEKGDYAFVWESSVTSYEASLHCDLTTIGPAFDHKGYGIALPPGTAYRDDISFAILKLIDEGLIATLEEKWWSGIPCPGEDQPTAEQTTELTVEHVAGIYITLTLGLVLALAACVCDRMLQRFRTHFNKKKKGTVVGNGDTSHPLNSFGQI